MGRCSGIAIGSLVSGGLLKMGKGDEEREDDGKGYKPKNCYSVSRELCCYGSVFYLRQ